MYVFCIFTVCMCISSLLVSCSVPLPVEHYHDYKGVPGRSTLCDCSLLVDCFILCSLFNGYTTLKHIHMIMYSSVVCTKHA